jgi:hypothetical protein
MNLQLKRQTSTNSPVYAQTRFAGLTPPVGGSGYGLPRSIASLIPTVNFRHILSALVAYLRYDAAQSPYPGRQNVVNSRNVMRNFFEIC